MAAFLAGILVKVLIKRWRGDIVNFVRKNVYLYGRE
jgi:hypothetical protein